MRTNDVQIEIEKGKEENKKTKISRHQQRKKEERRQHARGIRILKARKERGGGVAPRRNNRIRESATKESREAKVKAKKAIQESNGKRQDEMTKNERKRKFKNMEWDTENDQKERKKEKKRKERRYDSAGTRHACLVPGTSLTLDLSYFCTPVNLFKNYTTNLTAGVRLPA